MARGREEEARRRPWDDNKMDYSPNDAKKQADSTDDEFLIAHSHGPGNITELKVKEYTWEMLAKRMAQVKVGEKAGSYLIRGGELVKPNRNDNNLNSAVLFVIDGEAGFDGETGEMLRGVDPDDGSLHSSAPTIEAARDALSRLGYRYILHTTHTYRPGHINRWRAYIPAAMATKAELVAVSAYVTAQLNAAGLFIEAVEEMTIWSQPWYAPRCKAKYRDAFRCYASLVGMDVDVRAAVAWHAAQPAVEPYVDAAPPKGEHTGEKFISDFNSNATEAWWLQMLKSQGYKFAGKRGGMLRFMAPGSESRTPGVNVYRSNKSGNLIAYSHHGGHDPLSHRSCSAFDALLLLKHGGDFKAAFEAVKREAGAWSEMPTWKYAREDFGMERELGGDNGEKLKKATSGSYKFILNSKGAPVAIIANVATMLRENPVWQDVLAFDKLAGKILLRQPLPDATGNKPNRFEARTIEDSDVIKAAEWFQHNDFYMMKKEAVFDGMTIVAKENSFDPLEDKLLSLKWDGVFRLSDWLLTYCGAEVTHTQSKAYIRAAGLRWMISCVARSLRPGCKVDTALVLVGPQGKGKSTAGRILAYDEWFGDALPPLHSKDSSDYLRGKWIVEFGEMATASRADVEEFKAFMTRQIEQFRPPYGRNVIDYPRRCVFFGTTNKDAFLKDDTGNRRFWPVVVTQVDREALLQDRDQLWAEAVYLFKKGERWHLTDAEAELAAVQQEAFVIVDERVDLLRDKLKNYREVTTLQICALLEMKEEKKEQMEVASMLRYLGWKKERTNRKKYWVRSVSTSAADAGAEAGGGGHDDDDSF